MPKNMLHDIMTKEHRSIRHVSLPHKGRGEGEIDEDILYEREELQIEEPSSWRRKFLWGITFLFLILLGVALSTSFTGATVRVTPKHRLISVNSEFTAGRDAGAKLRFSVLPINETAETTIPADTVKKVSEKATGTVIIYNNFSDKPQRLIKSTRLETQDRLIYRIGSSIIVPGKTLKGGRTLPGSLETTITADSPGAEYNIPLSDFTVPGFKSDSARFAGFYARSKTPMSGGFEGMTKIPGEAALQSARMSLRETLWKKIMQKRQSSVPPGYVLWSGALTTKYESLPPEPVEKTMSTVKEQITGAAYLFKKDDVAKEIAKSAIPNFDNLPVEAPLLENLIFEFKEHPGGDPAQAQTLRFTLKGSVRIIWLFDGEKLKIALAGKPKDGLASTLSAFSTIEKADLVIRPFWSRSFPKNPKEVSIEEVSVPDP